MGLWESLVSSFQWRGQPQQIINPTSSVAPELLPESYGADCRPRVVILMHCRVVRAAAT